MQNYVRCITVHCGARLLQAAVAVAQTADKAHYFLSGGPGFDSRSDHFTPYWLGRRQYNVTNSDRTLEAMAFALCVTARKIVSLGNHPRESLISGD